MSKPATDVELPPLPRVKLKAVIELATAVAFELDAFKDELVTDRLVHVLATRTLGPLEVGWSSALTNLSKTFAQYVGRKLTVDLIKTLSWQIAARMDELQSSLLVAYTKPVKQEWIGVEIANAQPSLWRGDQRGVQFTFFALSGHPAGHTVVRNFPETWLNWFAYQIAFSRRIIYCGDECNGDPRHFIGMRIWGYLQPDPESDEISFDQWQINPQFKTHNVRILKLRTRFDFDHKDRNTESGSVECPFGYDHPCWECDRGPAACPASRHPRV